MHQKLYNNNIWRKFPTGLKRPDNVPANPSERLSALDMPQTEEEKSEIDFPYMSAVGSLLYSSLCARPDISFAVNQLARFNANPGQKHVEAAQQVLRHLRSKRTPGVGIVFKRSKHFDGKIRITGFVDSDWAGCPDTRRSTMGFTVHIAGGPGLFRGNRN